MKILFYTIQKAPLQYIADGEKADYMSDLLLHGFRELENIYVVDYPRKDHLYKDYIGDTTKLWGNGFTYSKILDDSINRQDIYSYDLIIVSVHHTSHKDHNRIEYIVKNFKEEYPDSKIIVVDGHDLTDTYEFVKRYTPYLFKREITDSMEGVLPISFAIPKEKVLSVVPKKDQILASIVPADHSHPNRRTHTFTKEEDYYYEYQRSYFALTCKKGGWDCMRHLEIMANGCLPIFTDLELCPKQTLTTLPKEWLSFVKNKYLIGNKVFTKNDIVMGKEYICNDFKMDEYESLVTSSLKWVRNYCTTKSLAKSVLEKIE